MCCTAKPIAQRLHCVHEPLFTPVSRMSAQMVLAALSSGLPVSGASLAARLGITRAAVWKQVEWLRAQGLPVVASPGAGYSLPWALELLDVEHIRGKLPFAVGTRLGLIELLWAPASTSSELRARRGQAPDLSVVLAEGQSAGRGRRGRSWCSPPGLNVYLSVLKRFDGGFSTLGGLSLAVGVMLLRALADEGISGTGLKWPNDLVAGGAKFGGVLVELDGELGGPCTAVIGVGINLRAPEGIHKHAGQAVTDLATIQGGVSPRRNLVVAQVIACLVRGLDDFAQHGFASFADEYQRHDALRGRQLRVDNAGGSWFGHGAGVDALGRLCVDCESGMRTVDSAETSVRVL